jgi:hypothetical protein
MLYVPFLFGISISQIQELLNDHKLLAKKDGLDH